MKRLDRALGILLLLRQGKTVSATAIAEQFEVSVRTVYRDLEALGELGVPVYAEMGREGGFRLLEGYFLPPVMLTTNEAISLLLGLILLRRLRVAPFPADAAHGEKKLLAALPDQLRVAMSQVAQTIGFEEMPPDIFHWGPHGEPEVVRDDAAIAHEMQVVSTFLGALLEGKALHVTYHSPYKPAAVRQQLIPRGLLWDRDWWYLVGAKKPTDEQPRLWRADRVLHISADGKPHHPAAAFDINSLLGRQWLQQAMREWIADAPVTLRLTPAQARQMQRDWYYRHARFETLSDGQVLMTLGEDDPHVVLTLLRWLGPGAELLEPRAWRALLRAELREMLKVYEDR